MTLRAQDPRIVVVPGVPKVITGPAVVFTVLNAGLLSVRAQGENGALIEADV